MIRTFIAATALVFGAIMANAEETKANVIEIATFDLADGVSVAEFAKIDARVEAEHISKQPGFVSRETGATETGWLVIVHWESADAAQASMDSFASAPAAAAFMGKLDASTMSMTRYDLNK